MNSEGIRTQLLLLYHATWSTPVCAQMINDEGGLRRNISSNLSFKRCAHVRKCIDMPGYPFEPRRLFSTGPACRSEK